MVNKSLFTSNTDDWKTPKLLYDHIINLGFIDTFKYQANYNEFDNNYRGEKLFINPPFSKLKQVSKWVYNQVNNKNLIVMIIPSRTDTVYFHYLLSGVKPLIYFIRGRLKYNDSKSAPFPTIALIWDTRLSLLTRSGYMYGDLDSFMRYIRVLSRE